MTEEDNTMDRRQLSPADSEWRALIDSTLEDVKKQLSKGDARMGSMQAELTANTQATERISGVMETLSTSMTTLSTSVQGVVSTFNDLTGGFRVLRGIGKLAEPVGYIAAAAAAIIGLYQLIKSMLGR